MIVAAGVAADLSGWAGAGGRIPDTDCSGWDAPAESPVAADVVADAVSVTAGELSIVRVARLVLVAAAVAGCDTS